MPFNTEQIKALQAKLDGAQVKTRTQAGRTLSYIEGWTAISEANRIFGFDAWQRQTVSLQETSRDLVEVPGYKDKPNYHQWRVSYIACVRITVGDVVREGTGYGSGMSKPEDLGSAIESAAKEAETDAMKRALMTFGNPFGLALYDKTQANVEYDAPQDNTFEPAKYPEPPRRPSGLPAKGFSEDGSRTAYAIKQDDGPDNWDAFDREINEASPVTIYGLAKSWSSISERDLWPQYWRDLAKEKIDQRRLELLKAMSPEALAEVPLGEALRASIDQDARDFTTSEGIGR